MRRDESYATRRTLVWSGTPVEVDLGRWMVYVKGDIDQEISDD